MEKWLEVLIVLGPPYYHVSIFSMGIQITKYSARTHNVRARFPLNFSHNNTHKGVKMPPPILFIFAILKSKRFPFFLTNILVHYENNSFFYAEIFNALINVVHIAWKYNNDNGWNNNRLNCKSRDLEIGYGAWWMVYLAAPFYPRHFFIWSVHDHATSNAVCLQK